MLRHELIALVFFAHVAVAASCVRRMPPAGDARRHRRGRRRRCHRRDRACRKRRSSRLGADGLHPRRVLSCRPHVLRADGARRVVARLSRSAHHRQTRRRRFAGGRTASSASLTSAYIGCFLIVPAGLVLLWPPGTATDPQHYWTLVMGAELGAFGTLPYLQTRPPWMLERLDTAPARVRQLHETRDDRCEHASKRARRRLAGGGACRSPHAAGRGNAAPGSGDHDQRGGGVTRAHFVVDVVTGVALAGAVWLLVRAGWLTNRES